MRLHAEAHRDHLRDRSTAPRSPRPALLTSTSMRPNRATARAAAACACVSSVNIQGDCQQRRPRHPPGPPSSGVGRAPWRPESARRTGDEPNPATAESFRAFPCHERTLLRARLDLIVQCTIRAGIRRAPPDRGAAIRPAQPTHRHGAEASARGARIRARRSPHSPRISFSSYGRLGSGTAVASGM